MLLVALAAALARADDGAGRQAACDVTKPAQSVCSAFCEGRCAFYNESAGERGAPTKLTVYRLTPTNVTGVKNKNVADASGDVSFLLSKKCAPHPPRSPLAFAPTGCATHPRRSPTPPHSSPAGPSRARALTVRPAAARPRRNLTQYCAKNPDGFGCFLDHGLMYGRFELEVDGLFGPYSMCNPVGQSFMPQGHTSWTDTRDFRCGQQCILPNASAGCQPVHHKRNGSTGEDGAWNCWCEGSRRQETAVGREAVPGTPWYVGPDYWTPQCKLQYYEYYDNATGRYGGCLEGAPLREVHGWDFASTSTMACEACDLADECSGWRIVGDNGTAQVRGRRLPPPPTCDHHAWPPPAIAAHL